MNTAKLEPNLSYLGQNQSDFGWLDLPLTDYQEVFNETSDEVKEIDQSIHRYHTLSKGSLEERISLLAEISGLFTKYLGNNENEITVDIIGRLNNLTNKKIRYLKSLQSISELGSESTTALAKYHFDASGYQNSELSPLFMVNSSSYSVKMKEFWGDFWLETLDPCHRRLSPYYNHWIQSTQPKTPEPIEFFLWLENQYVPQSTPAVPYLKKEELLPYLAKIIDGKVFFNDKPLSTQERHIFVIGLDLELYIAKGSSGLWHSSFTSGTPVLGAGVLEASDGCLTMISFESGHYRPTVEQGCEFLKILLKKGVKIQESIYVQFFENRVKYQVNVCQEELIELKSVLVDKSRRKLLSINNF